MKKIEIYNNEERVNLGDLFITNFGLEVQIIKPAYQDAYLDFTSIKKLKGNKELLEKTFQDVKDDLIYG
jgi:hypothetical protein